MLGNLLNARVPRCSKHIILREKIKALNKTVENCKGLEVNILSMVIICSRYPQKEPFHCVLILPLEKDLPDSGIYIYI